jgi:hypothetical protein
MTSTQSPLKFDVNRVFREEWDKAYQGEVSHTTFQPEDWFTAGRGKGEDLEWWEGNGAQLAQNFIQWYESQTEFKIWVTPDLWFGPLGSEPAIELPFEVLFGTVPVRGYIDLVLEHIKSGVLVVVDVKSGSTKPKNNRQLGIYATAIEQTYGIRPRYGAYFMCRGTGKDEDNKTFFQQPVDLSGVEYSYEYLSGEFGQLDKGIKAEVFPAAPGDNCRRCGVSHACLEVHGEQARQLDPNWPKGK